MVLRIAIGVLLWVAMTIALRLGAVQPGIGAIGLLIAFLIPFGSLLLRIMAIAADLVTGI